MTIDLEKLTAPFPRAAVKQRVVGGGKSLDYIEGHTCIHRLNDATGNHWNFTIDKIERTQIDDNNALLMAYVTLDLPGLGTRSHIGVQAVHARGGEDLVKGAVTDALKKAATLFGVGLELYGPDYASGDHRPANAPARRGNGPVSTDRQPPNARPARPAVGATQESVQAGAFFDDSADDPTSETFVKDTERTQINKDLHNFVGKIAKLFPGETVHQRTRAVCALYNPTLRSVDEDGVVTEVIVTSMTQLPTETLGEILIDLTALGVSKPDEAVLRTENWHRKIEAATTLAELDQIAASFKQLKVKSTTHELLSSAWKERRRALEVKPAHIAAA
jgi:hypothetical protein